MQCHNGERVHYHDLIQSLLVRKTLATSDKIGLDHLCNNHKINILHTAIEVENTTMLIEILNYCKDLNFTYQNIRELITHSIQTPDILKVWHDFFYLEPHPDMKNLDQPMLIAIEYSITSLLDKLLAFPQYRQPINEKGEGLVHIAVNRNRMALLICLQKRGYDFNMKTEAGYTPLRIAIINQNVAMISALINMNVDKDERDISISYPNLEPLLIRTLSGSMTVISMLLLKSGCDPNVVDRDNNNPLQVLDEIHESERQVLVPLLIDSGININNVNRGLHTPLDSAIFLGDKNMVRHLRSKGAISNLGNPILTAVLADNVRMMLYLINQGYDKDEESGNPNNPDHKVSPINLAIMKDAVNCIEILVALKPINLESGFIIPITNYTVGEGVTVMGKHVLLQNDTECVYLQMKKDIKNWDNHEKAIEALDKAYNELQKLEQIKMERNETMRDVIKFSIDHLTLRLTSKLFRNQLYTNVFERTDLFEFRIFFLFKLHCAKIFYQYYCKQFQVFDEAADHFHLPFYIRRDIAYYSAMKYNIRYHLSLRWDEKENFYFLKE